MAIEYGKNDITGGAIQQYNELQAMLLLESDEFAPIRKFHEEKIKEKRDNKKLKNNRELKLKRLKNKVIKSYEMELNKMIRSLKFKI